MLRFVIDFRNVMVNIMARKKICPCLGGHLGEGILVLFLQKAVLVFGEEIEPDA